jgi:mono/diheme cytochrome c family protein
MLKLNTAWLALALAGGAAAQTPAPTGESRGALLYQTHCVECHNAQVHWRDRRAATDWASLKAQVRLWQSSAALGWSEDDVGEVTRHLNDRYYHFKPAATTLSQARTSTPPVR